MIRLEPAALELRVGVGGWGWVRYHGAVGEGEGGPNANLGELVEQLGGLGVLLGLAVELDRVQLLAGGEEVRGVLGEHLVKVCVRVRARVRVKVRVRVWARVKVRVRARARVTLAPNTFWMSG